ncbi:DUF2079 domain-containing protein [Luteococcus peritonei]|uniref:DUF2079 domain-containing protein n=1 Tax=Luteococcus peritonei TaxID=88874 RepID=A0ABW4RZC8_9ACTN
MSHPAPRRAGGRLSRIPAVAWFSLAVFGLYAFYSLTRYPQFLSAGYDLGIFDQAVRRYSHFESPLVPLKGDHYNLLGDHFHPILAVLAPLYWIWDDPRTLVIAQAALVASSIPVVASFLARHLGRGRIFWALLVGYALSWPLQRLVDFDFHEICFAIPLLAIALDALDRRSDRTFVLASLVLLLVREDMGMVLAMLGVVRMLQRPAPGQGRRRGLLLGGALVALGTVVFFLVIKVVLPHFASSGQFAYWTYDALGPDAASSVKFILLHPLRTAEIFFTPWVKTRTLLYLLVPLALLPLRSPLVLVTLPLLAQRFLSSRTHLWTTEFHYSGPIFVILLFATVDALERFPRNWRRPLARSVAVLLLLTPVFDLAVNGRNFPFIRLAWSSWQTKPIMRHQQAVLAHIPAHTCLEVDDRLAAHLTRSNRVTLPTLTSRQSDFVVLDMSQKEVGYPLPAPQVVQDRIVARGYMPVAQEGPITVWRRPGYAGPTPGCGPDAP